MRLLGIDYGDKKIGLAFGESEIGVAVPLDVMVNVNEAQVLKEITQKIQEEGIEQVIVGVPLSQGAHHSDVQLKKVRTFIESLKGVLFDAAL